MGREPSRARWAGATGQRLRRPLASRPRPHSHGAGWGAPMIAITLAIIASLGVYLLYTSLAMGWRGLRMGPPRSAARPPRRRASEWLVQAGLEDVELREFAGVMAALFVA